MSATDWAAAAAAVISLVALLSSLRNRRADIAREEAYRVRARVWEVLDREPGLRTVLALDESDGQADKRVKLLRRTADQLDVAGAAMLGSNLREVLKHPWGADTTEGSRAARSEFINSAKELMRPAQLRILRGA
jgi:hypothetical protein